MAAVARQSDGDVVAQVLAGDLSAVELLYERYARIAFGLAYRILNDRMAAEDVVQDAFVALWRRAATFDPGRGCIRPWLLQIVRNRAIDRLRAVATRRESANIEEANLSVADSAWDGVASAADRDQVIKLLNDLPEGQRRAIELSYFGGLSHPQVAAVMGLPLGTVKGRQRLGLQKMRRSLESGGDSLTREKTGPAATGPVSHLPP
ncbi:MAG: sigma-70 family RNA polymerase sigma factor [Candidatus Dormibacteria bacterium]